MEGDGEGAYNFGSGVAVELQLRQLAPEAITRNRNNVLKLTDITPGCMAGWCQTSGSLSPVRMICFLLALSSCSKHAPILVSCMSLWGEG